MQPKVGIWGRWVNLALLYWKVRAVQLRIGFYLIICLTDSLSFGDSLSFSQMFVAVLVSSMSGCFVQNTKAQYNGKPIRQRVKELYFSLDSPSNFLCDFGRVTHPRFLYLDTKDLY